MDDCLYALQPTLLHLTRSSLHRCLQRHGISQLPDVDGDKPKRSRFKVYPIGYFHIDIAQVSTEQGKLHLFVAIDHTSNFAFVQLYDRATQQIAADFLRDLVAAVPYSIHTVLTDNGIQFTDNTPVNEEAEAAAAAYWAERDEPRIYRWHAFDWACEQTRIEHRLTKPRCPWTSGQVERMNRTIEDATVNRYHYVSHDELRHHLQLFVRPTITGVASRPCAASPPTKSSAKPGPNSPKGSSSIHHTTCRDRTSRCPPSDNRCGHHPDR